MPARLEKSGASRRSDVAAAGLRHSRAPLKCRDELRRELAAPADNVAPRLVDNIQLLAVESFHYVSKEFTLSKKAANRAVVSSLNFFGGFVLKCDATR